MVNLHFLNTIQALQQVNSALLCQLYPMWAPILTAYHNQVPNQLRIKTGFMRKSAITQTTANLGMVEEGAIQDLSS
ncbi:Protein unc-79 [Parelaphostrongylus tenuis]|uniref:Protein unc-79 n=1 Tax=Parelaphostrongylus tenuis TaxID=148309 RepID=A0AAD5QMV9_PARTN|nr:Protein unc-79 [Parelaphostrongylus tenuis]